MRKKIGFKEMWEHIEEERCRKIIQNQDDIIKNQDAKIAEMNDEMEHMRQILLQYAPEDVIKDYRNTK